MKWTKRRQNRQAKQATRRLRRAAARARIPLRVFARAAARDVSDPRHVDALGWITRKGLRMPSVVLTREAWGETFEIMAA